MIAATSPAFTVRSRPSRIGLPWISTRRFLTSSILFSRNLSNHLTKISSAVNVPDDFNVSLGNSIKDQIASGRKVSKIGSNIGAFAPNLGIPRQQLGLSLQFIEDSIRSLRVILRYMPPYLDEVLLSLTSTERAHKNYSRTKPRRASCLMSSMDMLLPGPLSTPSRQRRRNSAASRESSRRRPALHAATAAAMASPAEAYSPASTAAATSASSSSGSVT